MSSHPGKSACSRRRFLEMASTAGLGLLGGAGLLSSAGCSRRPRPENLGAVMARVTQAHKALGALPGNPVAVVQSERPVEYPFVGDPRSYDRELNECYPLVEEALMLLNPGNPENPLTNIVKPGDKVAIKPNWCTQNIFPVPITHPSIVHAVADLAAKAGASEVRIVEAPMTMTHAATWFYGPIYLGVKPWLDHLSRKHPGTKFSHTDGNADDFLWVSLGESSLLRNQPLDALCHDGGHVTTDMFYDVEDAAGHNPRTYGAGLYAISKKFLDCDVFINLPKMKTHGWTGITIALKNLMGLNVISTIHKMPKERVAEYMSRPDYAHHRECGLRDVPHYDCRYRDETTAFEYNRKNDVLWRSLGDLNRIILYCDRQGLLRTERQRRYLNIVDGIVGTDRDGPISLSRVYSRTIVAGEDPVRVDAACCKVMGYDPSAIPLVANIAALGPERPVGSLSEHEKSIVASGTKEGSVRAFPYVPAAAWFPDGKHNIFARKA